MTQETNETRGLRRSHLPLGVALAAGLIGVVAIAAGVAAGGPGSNASGVANAVPVVANATPAPFLNGQGTQPGQNEQNGQDGQNGQPGQNGQNGQGMQPGRMGGMRGGDRMGGMRGGVTVTSVSGSQISLKTDDGWTRTIDATGATVTKDGATASVADIKVGDEIHFQQTRNTDGTYKITAIEIELPHVDGSVTAASGSTITLKQFDGTTATVQVTSSTTYQVAGKANATLADVTVGSVVRASGTRNADGSITATTVRAFTPGQGMPGRQGGWDQNGQGTQPNQNGNGNGMGRPGHGWDQNGQDNSQQGQPNASAMPGA